ncbi:MAG: S9 family peptidase [Woeseiaceae bacterium]|nr:S9 family peptidase [Woeseiaceae bacterium]MDX2608592.1 S9 family peptidase [Woeseiaceae bacterium]
MISRLPVSLLLLGCFIGHLALAEPFSAEHLVRLNRVGAPSVSPDGSQVVYTLRTTDMEANKGRFDLWLSTVDGDTTRQLTSHEANDTDPAWSSDGKHIYFLSSRGDSKQVWRIALAGGEAIQVTSLPVDVGTFRLATEGDRLVVSAQAYVDCADLMCTAARDRALIDSKTTGVTYDRLFMRHWDYWLTEKRSRLLAVSLAKGVATGGEPVLLSKAIDADVPSRVWGGVEEYALSPDGSTVYFAARIRDAIEPTSTNFDIYSAPMNGDGPTVNLTGSNPAWDTQPIVSPDGKSLAYLAMTRPGFEADRYRIKIRDLKSGNTRELAADWDRSPSSMAFSQDSASLYATAQDVGNSTLWRIDVAGGAPVKLVEQGNVSAIDIGAQGIVFAKDDLKSPSELYVLTNDAPAARQLTHFSTPQLRDVEMGDYEQFSFTGAKGETVYGYVVKPAGFKKGKRYPVAFLIHGGPQGSFGNHFHYRWNPQTYAGQGFAAVFIDFHGSTGYGQAFTDSISGNWGGDPLIDLQLGLKAALEKYKFLDGERACALGASYGGFMVNWIAGNWPERFDCLVNHDGVFDQRMMYYATEELWFPEWENGGPYYAKPQAYEKYNPVNHVAEWQTPMFVIHGQLDYRVPVTQGIGAFTALQRRGIASKFLYFPDENHWVLKPQNSVQWHSEVNRWLHKYLE